MGLFIRAFASSGPDGKEKWPMGSIPGLCKNVLLGLIPNSEIHLLWDCPYKLLCWVVPMAKKNDLWDRSRVSIKCTVGTDPKWQNKFVMGLYVQTFVSSGPDGKEKCPMGLIPGLYKMDCWDWSQITKWICNGTIHMNFCVEWSRR